MEKTTKILIIAGSGLLILGVTAMIAIPKILNKKSKDEEIADETTTNTGSSAATTAVNPIGNTADVKKFQDWMDAKHPNWLSSGKSLNKGAGYGNFGSQTSAAWEKYGEEYQKSGNKPSPTVVTYKAYSAKSYNPIYSSVSDVVPYRLAGDSEYLGNLTGIIKKSYSGTSYAEVKQPDGKLKYVLYNTVKLKP